MVSPTPPAIVTVPHPGGILPFETMQGGGDGDGAETIDFDTDTWDAGRLGRLPSTVKMMAFSDPDGNSIFGASTCRSEAEARAMLLKAAAEGQRPCAEGHLGLAKYSACSGSTLEEALGAALAHYERAQLDAAAELVLSGNPIAAVEEQSKQAKQPLWSFFPNARSWVRATLGKANTLRKLGRVEEALPLYLRLCASENDQWPSSSAYVQPKYFVPECLLRCDPPRWAEAKVFMLETCRANLQSCFTFRSCGLAFRLNLALAVYMEYAAKPGSRPEEPPLHEFAWYGVSEDGEYALCRQLPLHPEKVFGSCILVLEAGLAYLLEDRPLPTVKPRLPTMQLGNIWEKWAALVYFERMLPVWQNTPGAIAFVKTLARALPRLTRRQTPALMTHLELACPSAAALFRLDAAAAAAAAPPLAPGDQCDGCHLPAGKCDGDITVCDDCAYGACEDCAIHACTSAQPCAGVGGCRCGSCQNERQRCQFPWEVHLWQGMSHPYPGIFNPPYATDNASVLHHNLSRGTCRCPSSNFGRAYADVGTKGDCYAGAKGGAAYAGPWKCAAQRHLEDEDVMMVRMGRHAGGAGGERTNGHGGKPQTTCFNHRCDQPGSLRCARCRSVWFCSAACQRASWSGPTRDGGRPHKKDCGKHLPSSEWPYIPPEFVAFRDAVGRYPGEPSSIPKKGTLIHKLSSIVPSSAGRFDSRPQAKRHIARGWE